MEVFHLHRATHSALCTLPDDIAPLVKTFLCPTRLDWRTCRKHEADLIRKLHQVVVTDADDGIFDVLIVCTVFAWLICRIV